MERQQPRPSPASFEENRPPVRLGVALLDRELRFLEVDAYLAELNGRPVAEHIGRPLHEVLPELAYAVEPLVQSVLATGEAIRECEIRGELPPGRARRWLASYEPVRARSGTVLAVECFVRELPAEGPDTTLAATQAALRRAEEEARESQTLSQMVFEACPDLIYIYDKIANRNIYANREVAAILGYTPEQVQAMGAKFIPATIHPDDLEGVLAFDRRVAASAPGDVLEHEYRMRRADGSYRWLYGREVVITREPDGRARLALGVAQDVTARKEARALIDTLVAAAPIGIAVLDRELRFVHINRALAAMNGLPVAAHVGRRASELFPGLGEQWEQHWRAVLATGQPVENQELSGQIDGVLRHALVSYYPIRIEAGEPIGVGVIFNEITELKQAEAAREAAMRAAQEERALLDTLIGSAPIGFDFVDRNLRFVRINEALATNNGPSVEEHLGRTVREVLPELADTVEPLLRQVIASGEPILDLEISGVTPRQPGVERMWRESLYPVRGPDGEVLGVGAIVTEITEHRRSSTERAQLLAAAQAAADRTAALQAITAALGPALTPAQVARVIVEQAVATLHARAGVITLLSEDGTALEPVYHLGYENTPLAGRRWPLSAAEPLTDAVRRGAPVLIHNLAEAEAIYPQLAATRAHLPDVAWANLPLINEERIEGALSLSFTTPQRFSPEDQAMLTAMAQQCAQAIERARLYEAEQQARKAAEQAVRERDELIALISHDLKNPLTVIQGQAQLLERRITRGESLEQARLVRGLTTIHQAAVTMSIQIEELLDVAMLRAGRPLRLDPQQVDLVTIVRRAATMAQANTERHELRLESTEVSIEGYLDGPRVERVVGNLLSNAVKYSPLGGEVTVTLRREQGAEGEWATISVADRGIGIPSPDLPRIFDGFHRAANTAGRIKGTGLGLTSAKRIVELHGGTIEVSSVEGAGSMFTVRLPL